MNDEREITSKDNSRLKHARAVRDGREPSEIFIEGLRLAEEAAAANLEVTDFFYTPEFAATERGGKLIRKLVHRRGAAVNEKLLESIADTKTPQGVVLLAGKPETGKAVLESKFFETGLPLIIVLHRLNNPQNVGAILRTAEAAGAAGVILTRDSADVFAPKSLRGAMGAAFRLPIWMTAHFGEIVAFCSANEITTICADVSATKTHTEIDWTMRRALIIGSEAHGLTAEEIAQTDESLKIPMRSPVESLNAAVACGVILYEAARQRQFSN